MRKIEVGGFIYACNQLHMMKNRKRLGTEFYWGNTYMLVNASMFSFVFKFADVFIYG